MNNYEGDIQIYLIAKFNEINGMENFLLYEPLILTYKNKDNDQNKNRNEIKDEDETDKTISKETEENEGVNLRNILLKFFLIILILIVILIIILSVFKLIRKIQIKQAYDKYIKGNDDRSKIALFGDNKFPFESKISFLIEN